MSRSLEDRICPYCQRPRREHTAHAWGLDCPTLHAALREIDQEQAQREAEAQAYEDYSERQADIRRGLEA